MPIIKLNNDICLFQHIPKCGGSTFENFLLKNGYDLSLFQLKDDIVNKNRLIKVSPQHLTINDISYLFNLDLFSYKLSITRHPIDRFVSAYNHNKSRIGYTIPLSFFLKLLKYNFNNISFHRKFNNHFLPQSDFVNDDFITYDLHEIQKMADFVSSISNTSTQDINEFISNKTYFGSNSIKEKFKYILHNKTSLSDYSKNDVLTIKELYKKDFLRFNYNYD